MPTHYLQCLQIASCLWVQRDFGAPSQRDRSKVVLPRYEPVPWGRGSAGVDDAGMFCALWLCSVNNLSGGQKGTLRMESWDPRRDVPHSPNQANTRRKGPSVLPNTPLLCLSYFHTVAHSTPFWERKGNSIFFFCKEKEESRMLLASLWLQPSCQTP